MSTTVIIILCLTAIVFIGTIGWALSRVEMPSRESGGKSSGSGATFVGGEAPHKTSDGGGIWAWLIGGDGASGGGDGGAGGGGGGG